MVVLSRYRRPVIVVCCSLLLIVRNSRATGHVQGDVQSDEDELLLDLDDAADGADDHQPAQMTQEWWDLHYSEMFRQDFVFTQDPRDPSELHEGDLTDARHFETAVSCSEDLLRALGQNASTANDCAVSDICEAPRARDPHVLVLGCGLSPLVFALADRSLGNVSCLEISSELVSKLRQRASGLPRPPTFVVGDIARFAEDFSQSSAEALSEPLPVRSYDVVIDENVLEGMGCVLDQQEGFRAQQRALLGISKLLRPGARLLTLSYLPLDMPPHREALRDWSRLDWGCPASAGSASDNEAISEPIHGALWAPSLP